MISLLWITFPDNLITNVIHRIFFISKFLWFKGRISRVDIKGEPVVAQHKHTSIE
ncbi:hypothetical protein ACJIZ3_011085 [Penstemon smallii]|uniref:Uncharacterized protein n=1 Tax=Penstemon smallii TaxID=265156 RepID=A0ABD3UL01_9LAMI